MGTKGLLVNLENDSFFIQSGGVGSISGGLVDISPSSPYYITRQNDIGWNNVTQYYSNNQIRYQLFGGKGDYIKFNFSTLISSMNNPIMVIYGPTVSLSGKSYSVERAYGWIDITTTDMTYLCPSGESSIKYANLTNYKTNDLYFWIYIGSQIKDGEYHYTNAHAEMSAYITIYNL